MRMKALKSLAVLPVVAVLFVLRDYATTTLKVLLCGLIAFVCFGGAWHCMFKDMNPRGWLERRRERKLMEFTNNRDRG